MNNKHRKDSKQFSLMLEPAPEKTGPESPAFALVQLKSASVIVMPSVQDQRPSFRERVVQDLLRTRVIVSD